MVVIASFYDGMPNVLLEAAGLRIPMLASTAGGMGDVLEDNQHGFLFHPGDAHECRKALQRAAMASDEELKLLGENCRLLTESRLSRKAETESYLSVFAETMRQTRQYAIEEKFADSASTISGD